MVSYRGILHFGELLLSIICWMLSFIKVITNALYFHTGKFEQYRLNLLG